jgi:hypothetical protein
MLPLRTLSGAGRLPLVRWVAVITLGGRSLVILLGDGLAAVMACNSLPVNHRTFNDS